MADAAGCAGRQPPSKASARGAGRAGLRQKPPDHVGLIEGGRARCRGADHGTGQIRNHGIGYCYFKVGVVLDDLRDAEAEPRSLFPTRDPAKSARLMAALDTVNARFGRGALRPLSTGLARPRGTQHARLSPRYTTWLDQLMDARAW